MDNKKMQWHITSLAQIKEYYLYSIGEAFILDYQMWYGEKPNDSLLIKPSLSGFISYFRKHIEACKKNFDSYIIIYKGRVIYSHNDKS